MATRAKGYGVRVWINIFNLVAKCCTAGGLASVLCCRGGLRGLATKILTSSFMHTHEARLTLVYRMDDDRFKVDRPAILGAISTGYSLVSTPTAHCMR